MDALDYDARNLRIARLVSAVQAGDREAFGELFGLFERTVLSIGMRRLGDYNEAEELCQDVFIQALTKIRQLREPRCFGSWLRSIANRLAINRLVRRAPATPTQPEDLENRCVEHRTPLEDVVRVEENLRVRAGLAVWAAGPGYAGGVLRARTVADRDERRVRGAAGNDQAAVARRPKAAGS